MEFTKNLVKQKVDKKILEMRDEALSRGIPVTDGETLNFLALMLEMKQPTNILEIGTAEGLSGIAMLMQAPNSSLTTIELNESEFERAKINFEKFELTDRVTQLLGDAGEIITSLENKYDFIFLDGPKAQYIKYLPTLKKLLVKGGVLFADDVLLYGYVSGEVETPPKRKAFVEKIRRYIDAVCDDDELITSVLNVGEGVALSIKL